MFKCVKIFNIIQHITVFIQGFLGTIPRQMFRKLQRNVLVYLKILKHSSNCILCTTSFELKNRYMPHRVYTFVSLNSWRAAELIVIGGFWYVAEADDNAVVPTSQWDGQICATYLSWSEDFYRCRVSQISPRKPEPHRCEKLNSRVNCLCNWSTALR